MGSESHEVLKYLTTIFLCGLLYVIVRESFRLTEKRREIPEFLRTIGITVAIALTILLLPTV